ncbi:MAG: ABC transporter permease [Verrucomicrobiales bacterium]|nr:ABC transporter permease [Verrucomicrobiales bacterium]
MKYALPREVRTIFKREFKGYFNSPIAYVLFVVFLGLSNGMSFFFFGVLESQEASLTYTYFQYMPLYLALIVPAVGMRIWSEEQRQGTMELMLTMPLAPWHAIVGKYLAAAAVIFLMLVLSFPIVWTINYLGSPDNGVIFTGFVATFFVALCYLAVTSVLSALSRSQLVAFLISFAICIVIYLAGFPQVSNMLMNLKGGAIVLWPLLKLLNAIGVMPHFTELAKGVLGFRDVVFFTTFVLFCLFATSVAIRMRRA